MSIKWKYYTAWAGTRINHKNVIVALKPTISFFYSLCNANKQKTTPPSIQIEVTRIFDGQNLF